MRSLTHTRQSPPSSPSSSSSCPSSSGAWRGSLSIQGAFVCAASLPSAIHALQVDASTRFQSSLPSSHQEQEWSINSFPWRQSKFIRPSMAIHSIIILLILITSGGINRRQSFLSHQRVKSGAKWSVNSFPPILFAGLPPTVRIPPPPPLGA